VSSEEDGDPPVKPYAVLRQSLLGGVGTMRTDSPTQPKAKYWQLWVHDEPGDFRRIDLALDAAERVFKSIPHQGNFLEMRFVETSEDLVDDELGDIVKFSRFQSITSS
jgi:hypothetical protein